MPHGVERFQFIVKFEPQYINFFPVNFYAKFVPDSFMAPKNNVIGFFIVHKNLIRYPQILLVFLFPQKEI
jgi:hypothetical protein